MGELTLQEAEAAIERLSRLEIGEPVRDGYGRRIFSTDAVEACDRLYHLWGDLERTLWSRPYQGWARDLRERCRAAIAAIGESEGLLPVGPPPRFPGYVDGGGNFHRPVQ